MKRRVALTPKIKIKPKVKEKQFLFPIKHPVEIAVIEENQLSFE
jgi:hypothetical protein